MVSILRNTSLKPYNTFGIDVKASFLTSFSHPDQAMQALSEKDVRGLPRMVLGGGSNVLFTHDYEGLILLNNIGGISITEDRGDTVLVKAGGGVVWHDLVLWTLDQNLQGIENMSLIPGKCGAAPIQNIGAYGVELKDTFHSLDAVELTTGTSVQFGKEECHFGYRDSIFKREAKGRYIITGITLELNRRHELHLSYGSITQELQKMGIAQPGIRDVSNAVCNIRRSKLPDPAVTGNAGSFFKNPEIEAVKYQHLSKEFPSIVAYALDNGNYKLAAGWLIEQCGWKGKRVGETGSHKDQALVLVNYGHATGAEIVALAHEIIASVKNKFRVDIEPEVNII
jgi:UDP-N-acetylmuramate dehydrogenase